MKFCPRGRNSCGVEREGRERGEERGGVLLADFDSKDERRKEEGGEKGRVCGWGRRERESVMCFGKGIERRGGKGREGRGWKYE